MQGFSDSNNPVFPVQWTVESTSGPQTVIMTGLTKREFFAAMAMQGKLSGGEYHDHREIENFAKSAVAYADALLLELSK